MEQTLSETEASRWMTGARAPNDSINSGDLHRAQRLETVDPTHFPPSLLEAIFQRLQNVPPAVRNDSAN